MPDARTRLQAAAVAMFVAAGVTHPVGAQTPDGLKAWLDGRGQQFSGAVLIGRGDQVLVEGAYGDADRRIGRRNTPSTRFNLGSINKTFTAVAIAQLIDSGRLSLDDRLAKILPDYPNRTAAATITIRDLIAHRSGIAQFMRADFGESTVAEMVRRVAAEPQAFDPGTKQEYSNGGYIVLGRIVEVLSGTTYEEYVRDHVYTPSGMTATSFLRATDAATAALSYYGVDARGEPMMGPNPVGYAASPIERGNPAGGGYSTVADLFKFARALKSGRLLSPRMTEYVLNGTFAEDAGTRFGFALREQSAGTHRFIGNGGGAPGINAEFRFEPAGEYTVVALSNTSPPSATQMLSDILATLVPGAASGPVAAPTLRLRRPDGPTIDSSSSPARVTTGQPQSDMLDRAALEKELNALHAEMIAAFREQPSSVARFYTPDARIIGGGRRVSGDQIAGYWAAMPTGATWTLEVLDFGGSRAEPWVLGRSTLQRDGGSSMVTDYVAILRRGADGRLRYHLDMFTSGSPGK
jgi:CubicO group peptidase (beta-lactamase class C family)